MKSNRKLFKIGHLTDQLGVTSRTIRYYDQMGLLPQVKRSDGNVRLFDDEDFEIIKEIKRLQKEEYLPLKVIKERLLGTKKNTEKKVAIIVDGFASCLSGAGTENVYTVPIPICLEGKEILDEQLLDKKIKKQQQESGHEHPQLQALTEKSISSVVDLCIKRKYDDIYVFLSHTEYTLFTENEKRKLITKSKNKHNIHIVETNTIGSGVSVFIQEFLQLNPGTCTEKEINIFMNKQCPLIYTSVLINSMIHMLDKHHPGIECVSELLDTKIVGNIQEKTKQIQIMSKTNELEEATDALCSLFEDEIKKRGGKVQKIEIGYLYLYSEAQDLMNKLKSYCPKVEIRIQKESPLLSLYLGREILTLSLI